MKTVRVKANCQPIEIEEISMEHVGCGMLGVSRVYTYTFQSQEWFDQGSEIEIYKEVEVPEKIKEFLEAKCLTKDELVDWLNKNYK